MLAFTGTFPGVRNTLGFDPFFPKSFAVPAFRDHIPKGLLPINSIKVQNLFPCCQFVLPEFPPAFRLVLRFPFLIVPDVGGASHFPLFTYTFSSPGLLLLFWFFYPAMAFTEWATALSSIVMAASSIGAISVSYLFLRPASPHPPPPPPPCPAVADVDAIRLELEELKQRLTDLEELRERLVGALH